jgi:hypothetical protein
LADEDDELLLFLVMLDFLTLGLKFDEEELKPVVDDFLEDEEMKDRETAETAFDTTWEDEMDPEDEREVLDSFFLLLAINSFSF